MSDIGVRTVYEFGEFRADPVARRLSANGSPLQLTPKAFETLILLLKNAGTVLAKDDLIDAIWGDTAVEENNLTQQISAIRRTLGDRSATHRFVVTIPGRGYVFAAPVRRIDIDPAADVLVLERKSITIDVSRNSGFSRPWRDGRLGMMLGLAYVLVIGLMAFVPQLYAPHSTQRSVAVLNFRSFQDQDDVMGQGIRDTLRARLGSLDDVAVRPVALEPGEQDPLYAGRAMKVDLIVSGSIQHEADRVRVAVELVDVARGRLLWGETIDRSDTSAFDLQDEIALHVVNALAVRRRSATDL